MPNDFNDAIAKAQQVLGGNSPLGGLGGLNLGGLNLEGGIANLAQNLLNNSDFRKTAADLTQSSSIRDVIGQNLQKLQDPNIKTIKEREKESPPSATTSEAPQAEAKPVRIDPVKISEILPQIDPLMVNLATLVAKNASGVDLKNQILEHQLKQQEALAQQQADLKAAQEKLDKQQEELQKQQDFANYQNMLKEQQFQQQQKQQQLLQQQNQNNFETPIPPVNNRKAPLLNRIKEVELVQVPTLDPDDHLSLENPPNSGENQNVS